MLRSIITGIALIGSFNAAAYHHEKVESSETHNCVLASDQGDNVSANFNRMILVTTDKLRLRNFRQEMQLNPGIIGVLDRVFGRSTNLPDSRFFIRDQRKGLSATDGMPALLAGSFGDQVTYSANNQLLEEVHFDQNLNVAVIFTRLDIHGGALARIRFNGNCEL